MPKAKSIIDTILGEAVSGTPAQRYLDMLAISSTLQNRSRLHGVPVEELLTPNEFNAVGRALPPGVNAYRPLAEKAWADVQANGPIHDGQFYATPRAAHNLPKGLNPIGRTSGHVYFSDPQGRAIGTTRGYVPRVGLDLPQSPPIPEARPTPLSPAEAIAKAYSPSVAATKMADAKANSRIGAAFDLAGQAPPAPPAASGALAAYARSRDPVQGRIDQAFSVGGRPQTLAPGAAEGINAYRQAYASRAPSPAEAALARFRPSVATPAVAKAGYQEFARAMGPSYVQGLDGNMAPSDPAWSGVLPADPGAGISQAIAAGNLKPPTSPLMAETVENARAGGLGGAPSLEPMGAPAVARRPVADPMTVSSNVPSVPRAATPGSVGNSVTMTLPNGMTARTSGRYGWTEIGGPDGGSHHAGKVVAVDPQGKSYRLVTPQEATDLAGKGWKTSLTPGFNAPEARPGADGGLAGLLKGDGKGLHIGREGGLIQKFDTLFGKPKTPIGKAVSGVKSASKLGSSAKGLGGGGGFLGGLLSGLF